MEICLQKEAIDNGCSFAIIDQKQNTTNKKFI